MQKCSAAAIFIFILLFLGTGTAPATECYPHCDHSHYYGPSDFTYIRPGLYGYPRCGLRGECSPYLVYSTSGYRGGRISIRFPRARAQRPPP
jgi:hypothetical protein